jgi:hypothetical protein
MKAENCEFQKKKGKYEVGDLSFCAGRYLKCSASDIEGRSGNWGVRTFTTRDEVINERLILQKPTG